MKNPNNDYSFKNNLSLKFIATPLQIFQKCNIAAATSCDAIVFMTNE